MVLKISYGPLSTGSLSPERQRYEMDQRFTSAQVVRLTGITPRQLQWWDERGIVQPQREGRRRLYTFDDVTEIAVICALRRKGFPLQRVRRIMKFRQEAGGSGKQWLGVSAPDRWKTHLPGKLAAPGDRHSQELAPASAGSLSE